jgi:hypothetical protein
LAVSAGNLFVAIYDGGTAGSPGVVLEYSLTGHPSAPVETGTLSGGGLRGPTGLAVDAAGTVYANSSQTGEVYALTSATPTKVALTAGGNAVTLSAPAGMAFDAFNGGTKTLLFDTNFFDKYGGSNLGPSVASFQISGGSGTGIATDPAVYTCSASGGPTDVAVARALDRSRSSWLPTTRITASSSTT